MTDGELLCNFQKCRKVLVGTAYITRCSHAFCEEDGLKEIEAQTFEKKCPACQTALVKDYDLVKVVLNPNDQFKSMVLAGHRPEIIMDIATRAIMFWNYQQHQEHLHQEMVSKHLRDMINQFKNDSEVETKLLKSEIQTLRGKIEDLEKELDKQNIKAGELSEKVAEKTRECQKWQMMYESLRRKQLSAVVLQRESSDNVEVNPIAQSIGPQAVSFTMAGNHQKILVSNRNFPHGDVMHRQQRSPVYSEDFRRMDNGFVFQPEAVNNYITTPKIFVENPNQNRLAPRRNYNLQ